MIFFPDKTYKLLLLIVFLGVWQTTAAQDNFTQTAKIMPNETVNSIYFGNNVALSGNTAISGAPLVDNGGITDAGAAYIHVRGANGVWTQQAKLVPNDPLPNRFFGLSVAISGETAFVGTSNSFYLSDYAGAVYVFTRTGSTWTQTQKLTASDAQIEDGFGSSLVVVGDMLLVGASLADVNSQLNRGAAYVFTRTGATWAQQAKLIADDGAAVNFFGESVAFDNDTAVIGAVGAKLGLGVNVGAAYVFTRSGSAWTQRQKLTASDWASQDEFGFSVDISGSTIFVGSRLADANQRIDGGAVYVFGGSNGTWTQRQKLTPPANIDGYHFGAAVALEGGTAIVGANRSWISGNSSRGAAFVFRLNNNGTFWIQNQMLTANDGASGDEFGNSLALEGGRVIIASFFDDQRRGSAYIFETPQVVAAPQTQFDFDGDGKADQTVFRPSDTVWYSLRSGSGFSAAQFGSSSDKIVPADFNGDGKTDIAVFRNGIWYWLNSSTSSFTAFQFGIAGDIPVPADYTGDGRAELAVYRAGIWYTWNLSNSQFNTVQFGISTDKPVPADFDADGKTDFAVYRDGVWYMLRSTAGFTAVHFGIASDKPTVGDYDGDSKADQAVYRAGVWYVMGSTQGFYAVQFGISSDVPVAADYDGDGKTDVAVFRDGVWYLLRSQQGFGAVQFGAANDKPIPAAFVP